MPTTLSSASFQLRQQAIERATARRTLVGGSANSPWAGYLPDVDPHTLDGNAANPMLGLVAQPGPSSVGEILRPGPGWARIDATRLPLGTTAGTINTTIMLSELERTNAAGTQTLEYDTTPIACSAGVSGTAGSREFWRITPTTGQWEEIDHSTNGTAAQDGREVLVDWCNFAAGAPARTSHSAAIDQPVQIWCTDPARGVDPVYVYPCDAAGGANDDQYEDLTDDAALDGGNGFQARSCEAFAGRVYYFNTSENGTHYRQRLRRTALFTADPKISLVGAGSHDFREFAGDGVRIETLGTVMAAYFEDGVGFVRQTGNQASPDAFQIITTRRGLMGTQALTTVGRNEHFGIFTDGWWFLSADGQWREAGLGESNGYPIHKWKQTFYDRLDTDNRHRIITHYDRPNNLIYIGLPRVDEDIPEVWIYDVDRDRVFVEEYAVTAFGAYSRNISVSSTVDGLDAITPGPTIDDLDSVAPTIDSFATEYGLEAMVHGNADGYVFQHDSSIVTREDNDGNPQNPVWSYQSPLASGGHVDSLKTTDRITLEYINAGNPLATIKAIDDKGNTQGATVNTNQGNLNEVEVAHQDTRLTARNVGFQLTGSGDIKIRSVEFAFFDDAVDERQGA